ncbi:dUMP phosphatase [compost metagenome]
MCNAINEKTGKNIEAEEMYLMVLYELDPKTDFCKLDLVQLYDAVEAMVLKYPPQLYATHTIDVLQQLKVSGATLNVLSNTAFIKGCTLRKVFNKIGLNDLFDFHLFSDETGVSKPNPNMFTLMHQQARAYHPNILPEDILHIGDNPRADIAGARAQGFQTFLVHQL